MRVRISRRDPAATAITKLLLSLHTQSFSLTPGPGTKVGCNCVDSKLDTLCNCVDSKLDTLGAGVGIIIYRYIEVNS